MLLNCLFPYFFNLRMDSLLMHLENMQPSSLVKEKGIFIVNGLNTWYPFPYNAMVYISYRVFSLTCPASMQIYWNKRKRLHKKRVQLPEDWLGTPTWPPFHCLGTPIWLPWRHVKTLYMHTCSQSIHINYFCEIVWNCSMHNKCIGLSRNLTKHSSKTFLHMNDIIKYY